MKLLGRARRFWLMAAGACVVVVAVVVLTVAFGGGSGPAASAAHTSLGRVVVTPRSGHATLTPRWSTTTACPAGYQGSAVLYALNTNGSIGSVIAPVVVSVTTPFGGTLLGPVGKIFSLGTNVPPGGTSKWVVKCTAGTDDTGATKYMRALYVTLSHSGSSYTTSSTPPSGTAG